MGLIEIAGRAEFRDRCEPKLSRGRLMGEATSRRRGLALALLWASERCAGLARLMLTAHWRRIK
jgi:hypothetical protein